jgi:uncharacterized protein
MPLQLSDIYIYPVKSLSGIRVNSWPVDSNGLHLDRHWMLIDEDNRFLSQRRLPQMALIRTVLTESNLIICAPGMTDLLIGLDEWSGETVSSSIWNDQCLAHAVSMQADRWFSQFLNCKCRLVYHPYDEIRSVDPNYATANDQTAFSDGFPFLIISENSLHNLNQQLPRPVHMLRFRPNLVVSGCAAYAEDTWREISINSIRFRLPKPCSRCSVPTIDPLTAAASKEPLATLNLFRKWQGKIYFGQNALHNSSGQINIGAEIAILTCGEPQPPLPPT